MVVSHPTRVRGLKPPYRVYDVLNRRVAPHAGAWIETFGGRVQRQHMLESHPTRVRGLKQGP